MGWVKRIPSLPHHTNAITTDAMALVEQHFLDHFGDQLPLHCVVTREQAFVRLRILSRPNFKPLATFKPQWPRGKPKIYRSYISLYINCGLRDPLEYIHRAERAYFDRKEPFNSVERSSAKS